MLIKEWKQESLPYKINDITYKKPLQAWFHTESRNPKHLLSYQIEVLTKLNTYLFCDSKVLLHLDTGLGKTFITLNLINQNRDKYLDQSVPILIIAPASNLIDPWCSEIDDFNKNQDRKYSYHVYHGPDKDVLNVDGKLHLEGFDFVLISYQTLESDNCNDYFFSTKFNLIIYDEPQIIINPNTETNTLRKLEHVAGVRRLALTASPLSNSINEFYILTTLLNNPENIGNAYLELKTLKDRNELIKKSKSNAKIISLSKFDKDVYEQMKLQPLREYKIILPVPNIVKEKLKELSSGAQRTLLLAKPEEYISDIPDDISFDSKTKAAELILSLIPKTQKVIIFSMHTECLDKLHRRLSRTYDCFKVVGEMTQKERNRVVNNFKRFKGQAIMLASLKANSTGLNYQEANNEIFMDSWYNPEEMKQARDRCFRMGQKNVTNVFYLATDTDHEKNIHKIKDSKVETKKEIFSLETESEPTILDLSADSNYLDRLKEFISNGIFKETVIREEMELSEESEGKPFRLPQKKNELHINFLDDEDS
ncbi:MAG: DEAD/DEAH box helicase [Treponemataceae bacterium]|nr:DEAD/DEAH box helicase [Treponemataceae bacterium]